MGLKRRLVCVECLDRQNQDAIRYCQAKGWHLNDSKLIDKALSGFHGKHLKEGALGEFVRLCEAGKIPSDRILLVEDLSRLSRLGFEQTFDLVSRILRQGVDIATINPDLHLTKGDLNNLPKVIQLVVYADAYYQQSLQKQRYSLKDQSNKRELARKGVKVSTKCPAWLSLAEDKQSWIVLETEVEKVRLIFKLCIDGLGLQAICQRLNALGIAPMPKSDNWTTTYIQSILRNRVAIGEYQPCSGKSRKPVGEPIKDYYVRIIDDATFYKAQSALDARTRHARGPTRKFINVLSGLVVDARSQSTMFLASKPQRDGSIKKSLFPSEAIKNKEVQYWSCPMDILEKAILQAVVELTLEEEESEDEKVLAGLMAKKETLQHNIRKTTDKIDTTPDFDAAMNVLLKLEASLKDCQEAIEEVEARIADKPEDRLQAAKQAIKSADRLLIRAKLQALIDSIKLDKTEDGDYVAIIYYKVSHPRYLVIKDGQLMFNHRYES